MMTVKIGELKRGDVFSFEKQDPEPWLVVDALRGLICSPCAGATVMGINFVSSMFGGHSTERATAILQHTESIQENEVRLLESPARNFVDETWV